MYMSRSQLNSVKADFSETYHAELPHSYYSSMQALEYQIPENAKPTISHIISQIRLRQKPSISILDLGCSYGVLAALIKYNLPLYALYRRYRHSSIGEGTLANERDWFATLPNDRGLKFYGIDISKNVIQYAKSVGLIEGGTTENLETELSEIPPDSDIPRDLDLIVSTGCIGYITDETFSKVFNYVDEECKPIVVSFVLRAFDYSRISDILAARGYNTYKISNRTFIQRRFRDASEQDNILHLLKQKNAEPSGHRLPESMGYYHAELFVSVHQSTDQSIVSGIV